MDNIKKTWTEVKRTIQETMITEMRRETEGGICTKWWDKTCHDRKLKLKEVLRRYKKGEAEVTEYRKEKKIYR